MNDLAKLLEKLAVKLGTTAELLWAVLIKQAYISAITEVVLCSFLILLVFLSTKFVLKKTKKKLKEGYTDWYEADWEEEGAVAAWFCIACFFTVVLVHVNTNIPNIVNGIFNPKFAALSYILKHIH